MNDMEYKPNSRKSKEEQQEKKKLVKVVQGRVKANPNNARKLADIFISKDVKDVKNYVLMDMLVPRIKRAIVDIVSDGINMIFFGERSTTKNGSSVSRVSYRDFSDPRDSDRRDSPRTRDVYSYDDITLENRRDAEEVLNTLDEALDQYGQVSVADLYDAVGITGDYTDHRYGWTNLSSAEIVPVHDGYRLRFPRARVLNR